jgi:hypothetical protein
VPTLSNSRHERFAQAFAVGESASSTYASAGYRYDRGNASRLTTNDSVAGRVAELHGAAVARAVITAEEVIGTLADIMCDDRAPASARVSAAKAVPDRAWGKPCTMPMHDEREDLRDARDMSDLDLEARIKADWAAVWEALDDAGLDELADIIEAARRALTRAAGISKVEGI